MPAHKRSSENQEDSPSSPAQHQQEQTPPPPPLPPLPPPPHHDHDDNNDDDDDDDGDDNNGGGNDDDDDDEDSQGSPSSSGEKDEYVLVKLSDIRKEVQCPICLGIIRKTRTVMECLHRFCRDCIDKSMRLGNNECPACRTHCASRRSLRDDPNYDALIASIYPDIDKYEEEELAFHEEEKNRNKQIQASIAQTLRRQFGRRRTMAKATAAAFVRKAQGGYRHGSHTQQNSGSYLRGKNRTGGATTAAAEASDDDDDDVEGGDAKNNNTDDAGGCDENDDDDPIDSRESTGASSGGVRGNREVLVWGKGGVRSHTRYGTGGIGGTNGKNARSSNGRVTKLLDYLHSRSLEENNDEFDIHCTLQPSNDESTPSLQQPFLCCRPTVSISHICQFIALQISVQAEDIEILVRKPKPTAPAIFGSELSALTSGNQSPRSEHDPPKEDTLEILGVGETVASINTCYVSHRGELVLVYRIKSP